MEPLALAIVTVDSQGTVTSAEGSGDGLALGHGIVGRKWGEVFSDWQLPTILPDDPKAYPFMLRGNTPEGIPVVVEMLLIPEGRAKPGCVAAVFRSDELTSLPYRLQQLCAVGEVACGVSHEINNALTLICGWLEVLRGEIAENSPHAAAIDLLREESARMAELTRNLQEVARGAMESPHELDLHELLIDVISLVKREMEKNRVRLISDISDDLPAVVGSTGRLKQALLNLLTNARQAMPDGGEITVSARNENGKTVIAVKDTGCGIPVHLHARVFRSFFTTKAEGTGLGLPITKRIVEEHGGAIRMNSEPGRGSTFTIELPAGSRK